MPELTVAEWVVVASAAGAAVAAPVSLAIRGLAIAFRSFATAQKETTAAINTQTTAINTQGKETSAAIGALHAEFAELRGGLDVILERTPVEHRRPPGASVETDERGAYSIVGRPRPKRG